MEVLLLLTTRMYVRQLYRLWNAVMTYSGTLTDVSHPDYVLKLKETLFHLSILFAINLSIVIRNL